jgi:hypothetical protein
MNALNCVLTFKTSQPFSLLKTMSSRAHQHISAGCHDAAQILAAHYYNRPTRARDLRNTAQEQASHAADELRNAAHDTLTPRRLAMLRELVHFKILTDAQLSQVVHRAQAAQGEAARTILPAVNRSDHASGDSANNDAGSWHGRYTRARNGKGSTGDST